MVEEAGRFLAGVAGVVYSERDGRYLLLRRSSDKDFAPGAWECVTGRVQQGEGFEDALRREVREETGLDVTVDAIVGTTHFYRGPERPEHELLGVVYLCSVPTATVPHIGPEHSEYRWMTFGEVQEMLRVNQASEAWLLRTLRRAEMLRKALPEGWVRHARITGFELG